MGQHHSHFRGRRWASTTRRLVASSTSLRRPSMPKRRRAGWTLDDSSGHVFAEHQLDRGTWERSRGWALWKALLTVRDDADKQWDVSAARRMGWRAIAIEILGDVCGTAMP